MNMGAGAACARARLLQMIEDLVRSIDIQMRTQPSHRFGLKASQDEHRAIVAACRAKNAQAVALLQAHIEHTQETLRQAL